MDILQFETQSISCCLAEGRVIFNILHKKNIRVNCCQASYVEEKLETVIEICERKQKQGREKHENFRRQSLSNYGFPANLPFAFEQFLLL